MIETLRDKIDNDRMGAFLTGISRARPKRISILDIPAFFVDSPYGVYNYRPKIMDGWPRMEWVGSDPGNHLQTEYCLDRSEIFIGGEDRVYRILDKLGYDVGMKINAAYDISWNRMVFMYGPLIRETSDDSIRADILRVTWHLRLATTGIGL